MCVDKSLVNKVQQGEESAYVEIVKKYRPILIKFCFKKTQNLPLSEDIVQDSLIKSYFKINTFEGRSSFKNWLFKITINTLRNKIRKNSRHMVSLESLHFIVENEVSEDNLYNKQVRDLIEHEVEKLPAKQKKALKLRVFKDMSFKEISDLMGCPYDTAKANYRHGLLKLKRSFEQDNLIILKDFLVDEGRALVKKYEML